MGLRRSKLKPGVYGSILALALAFHHRLDMEPASALISLAGSQAQHPLSWENTVAVVTLCSVGLCNLNSSYSICYSAPLQGSSGTSVWAVTAPLAACLNEQRRPYIRVTLPNGGVSSYSCISPLRLCFYHLCFPACVHALSLPLFLSSAGVIIGQPTDMTEGYGGLLFCKSLILSIVYAVFFKLKS